MLLFVLQIKVQSQDCIPLGLDHLEFPYEIQMFLHLIKGRLTISDDQIIIDFPIDAINSDCLKGC